MQEPIVHVGLVRAGTICFSLNTTYTANQTTVCGEEKVCCEDGRILWRGHSFSELLFEGTTPDANFSIQDVTIGISFHWERKETQTFQGSLRLIVDNEQLVAINSLPVEAYLKSVISSEMNATSSAELLKAHAIISRSWLMAQITKPSTHVEAAPQVLAPDEYIKWYDRDDHHLFDVCADDHCQRYQGITRAGNPHVAEAIKATRGILLMDNGTLCDARFSKCCGGALEEFPTAWEDKSYTYLKAKRDWDVDTHLPDLTIEAEAEKWICSTPPSFCNTSDKHILSQILNKYDQKTTHFYRWQVNYTTAELSDLIYRKTGIDYGTIFNLQPVQRGPSGRLCKLRIIGTKQNRVIGKELEIRRTLSETHLYSSAFVVRHTDTGFTLLGAGWGHGVGLCQIGAALMAEKGYTYKQILAHYYPGAQLITHYE